MEVPSGPSGRPSEWQAARGRINLCPRWLKTNVYRFGMIIVVLFTAATGVFADTTNIESHRAEAITKGDPLPRAKMHNRFKQYDTSLYNAISDQWTKILDGLQPATPQDNGEVILAFKLYSNGKISGLRVEDTTVDAKLVSYCAQAVSNSVPFAEWPKTMCDVFTNGFRELHFTFYYK